MLDRDGPHALSSVLAEFTDSTTESDSGTARIGQRYPRIRFGLRVPLCDLLRWLVWHRDGGLCRFCGSNIRTEVDHIIPWSAGGSDHSTNLRLLCRLCNHRRSNYRTRENTRQLAVAHCCDHCLVSLLTQPYPHQDQLLHTHRCPTCAAALGPRSGEVDRDRLRSVFCGHCLSVSIATNELRVL